MLYKDEYFYYQQAKLVEASIIFSNEDFLELINISVWVDSISNKIGFKLFRDMRKRAYHEMHRNDLFHYDEPF